MCWVIEFQGFKDSLNNFIIKEIAIVSSNGRYMQHWLVKSPYSFHFLGVKQQKMCNWLTTNFHNLNWDDGDVTIDVVINSIRRIINNDCLHVKGREKAEYLKSIFRENNIIELEFLGCPSLTKLPDMEVGCPHHMRNCALRNAINLAYWLMEV